MDLTLNEKVIDCPQPLYHWKEGCNTSINRMYEPEMQGYVRAIFSQAVDEGVRQLSNGLGVTERLVIDSASELLDVVRQIVVGQP